MASPHGFAIEREVDRLPWRFLVGTAYQELLITVWET